MTEQIDAPDAREVVRLVPDRPEEVDRSPLPTIAELVATPPTEACEAAMRAASEAARACPDDSPRRSWQALRADRAIGVYKRALRRDKAIGRRRALGPAYAACVCLGQGGRGESIGVVLRDRGAVVTEEDGATMLSTWTEVCPCPDGQLLGLRVRALAASTADRLRLARVEALAGAAGVPPAARGRTRQGWLDAVLALGPRRGRQAARRLAQQILDSIAAWEELMAEGAGPPRRRCVLLLSGNTGTGKSTLAALIALAWAERGRSVLYRTVPQLAQALRTAPFTRTGPSDPPTQAELIDALVGTDLLVLDDLGVEALGGDAQADRLREWLFLVVDGRLSHLRPTVVTTNLTAEAAGVRYDQRLEQRLFTPTHAVRVPFPDPDIPCLRDEPEGEPR